MSKRFPSIRFFGDRDACQQYIRRGKQELFRTKHLRDKLDVAVYARTIDVNEYTVIRIELYEDQEFIYIDCHPPVSEQVYEVLKEQQEEKGLEIYSGFSYSHQLITTDNVLTLTSFEPTLACRTAFPRVFSNAHYIPVERLALQSNTRVRPGGTHTQGYLDSNRYDAPGNLIGQPNLIHPCQYSGPISRAASLCLGLGTVDMESSQRLALIPNAHSAYKATVQSTGFCLEYDCRWVTTHNICQDTLGRWWLILINSSGVFARRLPVIKGFRSSDLPTRGALSEFQGVPSGEAFPTSFTADGEQYIQLMDTNSLWTEFRSQNPFSDSVGWVFNEDGSEGRICTYKYDTDGWMVVTYWRLVFHMRVRDDGSMAKAVATLQEISSGIAARPGVFNYATNSITGAVDSDNAQAYLPIYCYQASSNTYVEIGLPGSTSLYTTPAKFNKVPEVMDVVCWVGWINGEWHEIRYRAAKIGWWHAAVVARTLDPVGEFAFSGPIPMTQPNGVTVDPNSPCMIRLMPEAPSLERADVIEKFKDYAGAEVVSNDVWRNNYVIRRGDGHDANFQRIAQARLLHWEYRDALVRRPQFHIYFIIPPYNRNAYYLFEFEHRIGLAEYSSFFFPIFQVYDQIARYTYNSIPDAFTQLYCGNGYPYSYNPSYVGTQETYPVRAFPPPIPVKEGEPNWNLISHAEGSWPGFPEEIDASPYYYVFDTVLAPPGPILVDNPTGYWASYDVEVGVCPGYSTCFCDNFLWNQAYADAHQTMVFYSGSWPPGSDPNSQMYIVPMPEQLLSGGNLFVDGIEVHQPAGLFDNKFNYAKESIYNWNAKRHWYLSDDILIMDFTIIADRHEPIKLDTLDYVNEAQQDIIGKLYQLIVTQTLTEQAGTFWCQTSVLGEPAMIYSDPSKATYTASPSSAFPYFLFYLEKEGVHPAVPTALPAGNLQYARLEQNDVYRYLTFVGVNGP